jgi:hypothetical protein
MKIKCFQLATQLNISGRRTFQLLDFNRIKTLLFPTSNDYKSFFQHCETMKEINISSYNYK